MMKKNVEKKALTLLASIAKKTSSAMANQACAYWQHDPKMPKSDARTFIRKICREADSSWDYFQGRYRRVCLRILSGSDDVL